MRHIVRMVFANTFWHCSNTWPLNPRGLRQQGFHSTNKSSEHAGNCSDGLWKKQTSKLRKNLPVIALLLKVFLYQSYHSEPFPFVDVSTCCQHKMAPARRLECRMPLHCHRCGWTCQLCSEENQSVQSCTAEGTDFVLILSVWLQRNLAKGSLPPELQSGPRAVEQMASNQCQTSKHRSTSSPNPPTPLLVNCRKETVKTIESRFRRCIIKYIQHIACQTFII